MEDKDCQILKIIFDVVYPLQIRYSYVSFKRVKRLSQMDFVEKTTDICSRQ